MPRRADRAAIEAALSPTLRAALAEFTELLRWGDGWRGCVSAKQLFEVAAVVELGSKIQRESGCGDDIASARACGMLGLNHHTIKTRYKRWFIDTRVEKSI